MDQQSRKLLIGGSLFLQSVDQAQANPEHFSGRFWFREDSRHPQKPFADLVKGFLDSMALLLVPKPGVDYVTACSLDLQLANDPGDQAFTLRIARNGSFTPDDDQKLKALAEKIVKFIETGTPDQEKSIPSEIILACREKIENCIKGRNPRSSRIDQFSATVKQLSGCPVPAYIPSLEGSKYAGKRVYTRETTIDAFTALVRALKAFLQKVREVICGNWDLAPMVAAFASSIRNTKVFMSILSECLAAEAIKAKRYLERIAAYDIALRNISIIHQEGNNSKPPFPTGVAIALLPPRESMFFRPLTLHQLSASVLTEYDRKFLRVPHEVRQSYTTANANLKEHCEVRLVRFYIENSKSTTPMIPYLGVSKLSCILCGLFLKNLQELAPPGPPIEFAVRGEHGKIYGQWLPPDHIVADDDTKGRVLRSLQLVSSDIQARIREKFESWLSLPMGGDSPGWSSDENSKCISKSPNEELDEYWEHF